MEENETQAQEAPTTMAISIREFAQMQRDLVNLKKALSLRVAGFSSQDDWVIEMAYQIVANTGGWNSETFPDE